MPVVALSAGADFQREVPSDILIAQQEGFLPKVPTRLALDSGQLPSTRLALELPPLPVGLWASFPQVTAALIGHSIGNLTQSGLLAIAMLRDPKIFGPLNIRAAGTVNLPMRFRPANDSALAKEIAEYCETNFSTWFPVEEQIRFERTVLVMGVSLAQLIWKPIQPGKKTQDPEINCWSIPSSRLFWYWDPTRNYGHWLAVDAQGNFEPVPGDGQWISAALSKKEPWNEGLINPCGYRYAARMTALLKNGQFMDRMASSFFVLSNAPTNNEAGLEVIRAQLQTGNNPFLMLPSGDAGNEMKAAWVGVMSDAWQDFGQSMELYAGELAVAILGQTLTTSAGSVGSHALGKVHENVRQDLIDLDCARRAVTYREQILKPIVIKNFDPHNAEMAPYIEYSTERATDPTTRAAALANLGNFFKNAPENTDRDKLQEEFDVPVKRGGADREVLRLRSAADDFDIDEEDDSLDLLNAKARKVFCDATSGILARVVSVVGTVGGYDELPALLAAELELATIGREDRQKLYSILMQANGVGREDGRRATGIEAAHEQDLLAIAACVRDALILAQLDVVSAVQRLADKAKADGLSFEDACQALDLAATRRWGSPSAPGPTVAADTNIWSERQGGYRAALFTPEALAAFPLHRFRCADSPCPICDPCDGVTLPAAHGWWRTHTPMLHFGCKCEIEPMTSAAHVTAERLIPGTLAAPGFGEPAGEWSFEGKPPALVAIARKRMGMS